MSPRNRRLALPRRALLGSAAAACAVGSTPANARESGLAALAAPLGVQLGTMTTLDYLKDAPQLMQLIHQDATLVVPGWEFMWERADISGPQHQFDDADNIVAILGHEGFDLRGHCLVWYNDIPKHIDLTDPATDARKLISDRINGLCRRYAKRVQSWVVVNEPLFPDHQKPNAMRNSPQYRALGPDYLRIVLDWAAQADPSAHLLINEYNLEQDDRDGDARRAGMLAVLNRLVQQGAPIHGLGLQAHLTARGPAINPDILGEFLRSVASLGLKIHITEMDVIDRKLPGNIMVRDAEVADLMHQFLQIVLAAPGVASVCSWGLDDAHTWMNYNDFTRRSDGLPARGQIYDAQFQRKPAWQAFAAALRETQARRSVRP